MAKEFTEEEWEASYTLKMQALESVLGESHGIVGHAIVPFYIGGAMDMYYFPNHIKGTGFATMELLEPDGTGPLPNNLGTYELVAFTKHIITESNNDEHPFNLIERRICGIFTNTGFFSREAVLKVNDTCEIPRDGSEENICLVFDNYSPEGKQFNIGESKHHLLLCLEIFRSEMDFARREGSKKLFEKLKEHGHYPYGDLDRFPVV